MRLRLVPGTSFAIGDLVSVKNMPRNEHFCIIAVRGEKGEKTAVLKALFNDTYITEKPVSELVSLLIKGRL
ncbi:MAG: hypothetical protein WC109_04130 [Syntrophomonadaceae bacterium]|nr:hypothetical protein [Syntrophomonadaceae bacterium]MDD3271532.1 hypothetical protein [Syntrophomonadaceae bacterium]MDD3899529.1 hypothetical protein [Syntrophomonadaceae bacterium]MDD4562626.1 hypothetical protein [Syntrophomonadaceae bacterium]